MSDAGADRVHVFTFKEGLLSRVAHDLRLSVERFSITRDDDEIVASFDPRSLVVDGVMKEARLDPRGLGDRDRAKIRATIETEILRARVYPSVEFRGRVTHESEAVLTVEGELELVGVRRPVRVSATRTAERIRASVTLRPSEFGVRPYRALAGAIRLQDRVRVELDLDAAARG